MAQISLCMVVKNEEAMLPRFFAAVAGLWDELIVLDTGSEDQTISLCREQGALVVSADWRNDFAAARNITLELATGQWVLVLDPDEVVSPEVVESIRCLSLDPDCGAIRLTMRNRLPHGHHRDAELLRMWRHHDDVRFKHAIHEDVSWALQQRLDLTRQVVETADGIVEHYGYVRSVAAARDKKDRDRALLEICIAEDESDFYSWFKLLELARFWADQALWRRTAWRARRVLEREGPDKLVGRKWAGELITLVASGCHPTDTARALDFLEDYQHIGDTSAEFLLHRGQLREQRGDWGGARSDYRSCLDLNMSTDHIQMATVRPELALARLDMSAGRIESAESHVDRALRYNPRDPEALFAAVALRAKRDSATVRAFAVDHAATYGDCPELHGALGELALLQGRVATAVGEFRAAAGHSQDGLAALRLAQSLLCWGDIAECRALCERLAGDMPKAALGILLCDLVSGRDSEIVIDLEEHEANDALAEWLALLMRSGHTEVLRRLRLFAPAIAPAFPWVPEYLAA